MLLQHCQVVQNKLVGVLNVQNKAAAAQDNALHVYNVCLQFLVQLQDIIIESEHSSNSAW